MAATQGPRSWYQRWAALSSWLKKPPPPPPPGLGWHEKVLTHKRGTGSRERRSSCRGCRSWSLGVWGGCEGKGKELPESVLVIYSDKGEVPWVPWSSEVSVVERLWVICAVWISGTVFYLVVMDIKEEQWESDLVLLHILALITNAFPTEDWYSQLKGFVLFWKFPWTVFPVYIMSLCSVSCLWLFGNVEVQACSTSAVFDPACGKCLVNTVMRLITSQLISVTC